MRIRNLYHPVTFKKPVTPWVPGGTTVKSEITAKGCEITVTGSNVGWLYPPDPQPDGLAKTVWQKSAGTYAIGIDNDTIAIYPGVTTLTRLSGYESENLVTLLKSAGLPLVFSGEDHPY